MLGPNNYEEACRRVELVSTRLEERVAHKHLSRTQADALMNVYRAEILTLQGVFLAPQDGEGDLHRKLHERYAGSDLVKSSDKTLELDVVTGLIGIGPGGELPDDVISPCM